MRNLPNECGVTIDPKEAAKLDKETKARGKQPAKTPAKTTGKRKLAET
jgi:hypothetical protein